MVMRQRILLAVGLQLLLRLHWAAAITRNVHNARELRDAVNDLRVETIFLIDSVRLRPYNGWNLEKDGPIPLGRNLTIVGDDQWEKHITMDFSSLLSGHQRNLVVFEPMRADLALTFQSVHLVGLPFIASNSSSAIFPMTSIFNRSIIETYTPFSEPSPDWISWIKYPRAPGYPALGSETQLIKPVEKKFCDQWCKVECPKASYVYLEDAAFLTGYHNTSYFDEIGDVAVEDSGVFRALDTMLLFIVVNEWTVNTTENFKTALETSYTAPTIIVIDDLLSLWPSVMDCPVTVSSKLVIKGSSNYAPPVDVIDFGFIMNCTIIEEGSSVILENLLLTNSVIDSPTFQEVFAWQALVGFFAPMPGAGLVFDNVVWHTKYLPNYPLSTGSIAGDLEQRQRQSEGPGALDTSSRQSVKVKDSNWCTTTYIGSSQECILDEDCRTEAKCPNGAVFIEDVKYNFTAAAQNGDASYMILHSLLVPEEVQAVSPEPSSDTNGGQGTPQFIVIMLVVLGVVGFGVAATALILSKLRSKANHDAVEVDEEYPYKGDSGKSNELFEPDARGGSSGQQTSIRTTSIADRKSRFSLAAQKAAEKMFGNITLGDLLGQGGFGRVYKAAWNGAVVAVKVIEIGPEDPTQESSIEREVSLLLELRHPNIVNLYRAARRPVGNGSSVDATANKETAQVDDAQTPGSISSGSNPPTVAYEGNSETWMVMEFCDKGTLRDLLRSQFFFKNSDTKEVNMQHAIYTCQDIARGFQYLHEQNMLHGDLKPHNILLQTSGQDSRGFIAKLADFGVSRKLQGSQMYTGTVGTMTYMPPELLGQGKISNKTDVYAFGLIMWQLITCDTPFVHVTPAEVWRKVVIENYRPVFPDGIPDDYKNLASACWDAEPKNRPSFDDVQNQLWSMLKTIE